MICIQGKVLRYSVFGAIRYNYIMVKMIKKWLRLEGKEVRGDKRDDREYVVQKTREGTDWTIKRYRGALEKLAEYDRS